ncbi:MAG: flagellar export chaperone FliS [Gammaproteobacteria bacterium]
MNRPMNAYNAVDQYARLSLRTDIESASPHRLILMLIDGGIDKIRAARLAMQRGAIAEKGANISWAISIIDGLRASLNLEQGGQLAANLDNLYDYMSRTLLEANLHNDIARLDVVEKLLQEIRAGWKGIEGAVDQRPHAHDNAIGPNAVATS